MRIVSKRVDELPQRGETVTEFILRTREGDTDVTRATEALARDHRYTLEGPLSVSIELDDHQRLGAVEIESHFVPSKVTSSLVLPDHSRRALGGSTITIGRHADCEVVLSDQNASRRHCEIRPTAGGYVLVDLGSTNGTKLNGAPCHAAVLQHGDVIVIGQSSLWFEQG